MKKLGIYIILLFCCFQAFTQDCQFTLSGKVLDKASGEALLLSNVFVEETRRGQVVDSLGQFEIGKMCKGKYHIRISHIGCETQRIYVELVNDTFIEIALNHHHEMLEEVVVHGSANENSPSVSRTIDQQILSRESNKSLSGILERIEGVSVLKSGAGISKPIVHGLYGNRISILNNGIEQAGQQWGNDHAPEIDPNTADHISVVKGASALEYGANSSGSVILVEAPEINDDPHIHGKLNYIYNTNSRGHSLNLQAEQNHQFLPWKLIGTFKKSGDAESPDYFLNNTGRIEKNLAFLTNRMWGPKWESDIYYSLFSTKIGILRGSHIGNLTDLEAAIGRTEPFYTESEFSDSINPPNQTVNHHLLKVNLKNLLSDDAILEFTYGGQLNDRKEFDVRRSGRSDIPALSIKQWSHWFGTKYNRQIDDIRLLKLGLDINLTDNTNDPETGILPLIPDYRSFQSGLYSILQVSHPDWGWELGARIDFRDLLTLKISNTIPREIIRVNRNDFKFGLNGGAYKRLGDKSRLKLNIGFSQRNPEVNELFSSGLHQGVAGIEEGDEDLSSELSLKTILSLDQELGKGIHFNWVAYWHQFSDFIFLEPQDEFRLTIRGAFPVFKYRQSNARLIGSDLSVSIEPARNMRFNLKYALVRGKDIENDSPLVYMPADNLELSWSFFGEGGNKLRDPFAQITTKYVFKQDRFDPEKDFLAPPDSYLLTKISMGAGIQMGKTDLKLSFEVDNLFNKRYRDYLNRNRYFADELGRNINLRCEFAF